MSPTSYQLLHPAIFTFAATRDIITYQISKVKQYFFADYYLIVLAFYAKIYLNIRKVGVILFTDFIFDYGNVLINFNTYDMMKPYFDEREDIEQLAPIIFDRLYWDKLDSGELTEKDVVRQVADRVPASKYEGCVKVLENWYRHTPPKPQMCQLVSELKKSGKGVYLISNISKTFAKNYSKVAELESLFQNFDGIIFSATAGYVKPQPEIFELLIDKYELNPKTTLFIDDNINNINGAKKLGISTFLFKDNCEELNELIFN